MCHNIVYTCIHWVAFVGGDDTTNLITNNWLITDAIIWIIISNILKNLGGIVLHFWFFFVEVKSDIFITVT